MSTWSSNSLLSIYKVLPMYKVIARLSMHYYFLFQLLHTAYPLYCHFVSIFHYSLLKNLLESQFSLSDIANCISLKRTSFKADFVRQALATQSCAEFQWIGQVGKLHWMLLAHEPKMEVCVMLVHLNPAPTPCSERSYFFCGACRLRWRSRMLANIKKTWSLG